MPTHPPSSRGTAASTEEEPPPWWPTAIASVFVVLSLAALAAIPIWAASRIEVLRTEIQVVAEPTHPLAARLQFMLAREAASVRGFLVTPDDSFLIRAREARVVQEEIYTQLEPLSRRLGPTLEAHLAQVRDLAARWHLLQDSLYLGLVSREVYAARLLDQREAYRRTLEAAERFDYALARETEQRRQEIAAVERRNFVLSTLLAVAALLAAVTVGWLTWRERRFALENARLFRETSRAASRWQFLAEANEILGTVRDYAAGLRGLARHTVRWFARWCRIDLVDVRHGSVLRPLATEHAGEGLADDAPGAAPAIPAEAARIAERAIDSGRPVHLRRSGTTQDPMLAELDATALISVPLVVRGEAIGALTIAAGDGRELFDDQDVEVIVALAGRTALAVDNARLYESAIAGDRSKTQFLAVVSHELRTPLNAVVGYADLLHAAIGGPLTEGQAAYVARIRVSASHLLHLIEEILTYANLGSEVDAPRLLGTEVAGIVDEALMMVAPLAAAKGLEVRRVLPAGRLTISTDSTKLRRILVNLLSNAVKFTEQGSIVVTLYTSDGQVVVAVEDTGIGMPPEQLEGVFRPFWQAEEATTRRTGGLGLGLAISRRLAEELGGSMHATSEAGRGSRFEVRLPL